MPEVDGDSPHRAADMDAFTTGTQGYASSDTGACPWSSQAAELQVSLGAGTFPPGDGDGVVGQVFAIRVTGG